MVAVSLRESVSDADVPLLQHAEASLHLLLPLYALGPKYYI
jgi:hypothetical protein